MAKRITKTSKQKLIDKLTPKRTKFRKARKPMSAEQKAKAVERLAKARAAKQAKNPSKKQTHHPSVYLPEARPLEDVLSWLKNAKDMYSAAKSSLRQKGLSNKEYAHRNAEMHRWYGYQQDINWYLRTGDWICDFWGSDMQMKTKWVVTASGSDPEFYEGRVYTIDDLKKVKELPITKKRRKRNETK